MYSAVTRSIRINVEPTYLEDQSEPERSYYVWAYHVVIENKGEQTPVYAITFELYENGVSRALVLDYGDFVLTGEMTSLDMKDAKPCP